MTRGKKGQFNKAQNLNAAKAAWGEDMPEWVSLLAEMCDRLSQGKAAKEIRYSAAVVNTVLKNAYNGDLGAVQRAVEGALMKVEVACPVLGQIRSHKCISEQRKKLVPTSALSVRLWRACRNGCQNFRGQVGGQRMDRIRGGGK